MRIALAKGGDLVQRVQQVLLADARVQLVGVRHAPRRDRRVVALDHIEKFDLLIAEEFGGAETEEAISHRVPIVVADDLLPSARSALVIDGANLRGLARSLAVTLSPETGVPDPVISVTTFGRKLSRGAVVSFPYPVGSLHTEQIDGLAVAPHEGNFAALRVSVASPLETVTHGLVDDGEFAAAACLAASAIAHISSRTEAADETDNRFVAEAIRAGLSVASLSI